MSISHKSQIQSLSLKSNLLKLIYIWLVAALLAICSSYSQADENVLGDSKTSIALSYQDCLKYIQENNNDYLQSTASLKATQMTSRAAWGSFLPTIDATASYNFANTSTSTTLFFPQSNPASVASNNYSLGLSATENLFSGFYDQAKLDQSKQNIIIAEAKLQKIKSTITQDLRKALAALNFAKNNLKLSQDIIKIRQEDLKMVELRYKNGNENKGSVLLSQAYLQDAFQTELMAKNQLLNSEKQLLKLLGLESYEHIEIKDEPKNLETELKPSFDSLVQDHPDHIQYFAQTHSSEQDVVMAKSNLMPSLNLSANTTNTGEWFPQNNKWVLGLTLTIPLFSGGSDYYKTQAAHQNLAASIYSQKSMDQQIRLNLVQVWTNWLEAVGQIKVDEQFLTAAKVRSEIGRGKYNNGISSFEDWDLIENELIKRRKNILTTLRDRSIAEANWLAAQGKADLK